MTLRIGVLGAGSHSTACHGPALRTIVTEQPGRVQLAAMCDLDEARARDYATRFGFDHMYTDLDQMLGRESLDGLLAITPLDLTEAMAERLLPRGIPLLIEKPPGTSSVDTQRMLACAREHQTPHMISFNRRHSEPIRRAQEWLADDRPPLAIHARMLRANRLEDDFVVGTGIHLIDTVLSLMGTPRDVVAHRRHGKHDRCPSFQALLQFDDQRSGTLTIAPDAGVVQETYEILGRDYTILMDTLHARMEAWQAGESVLSWQGAGGGTSAVLGGTVEEMQAFIELIEDGQRDQPDLAAGLAAMTVAEAIDRGGKGNVDV